MNCRGVAARILHRIVEQQQSMTPLLSQFEKQVPEADKGLLQALCFGTCRHYFSLNALAKMLLNKPLRENASEVHSLICVGLFQLAYSEISPHAAINETVEACEQLGHGNLKSLVNAILRRFQREQTELMESLEQSDVPKYEHPKWLIKRLKHNWPEQWQTILEHGNTHPPLTLRVNTHKLDRSDYLLALKNLSLEAENTPLSSVGLTLRQAVSVAQLPNFDQGHVSVQDEAAQLTAQILQPQAGERVLDACAAPGGKTCALLEFSEGNAHVVAMDADEKRLLKVSENLQRLGYTEQAEIVHGDAQHPESWWDGKPFDKILLDVPCSATGVIRRHPDIKLLRQREDIDKLADLQGEILKQAWSMLKPGGQLLYATCSILPQENSQNIQRFLAQHEDAELQPLPMFNHGDEVTEFRLDTDYGWQLFPQRQGHDGFFYALLQKQS